MSDDFSDLEAELKQLRPRAVRPVALARLAAASPDAQPAVRSSAVVWLWPALGAAAAAAVMVLGVAKFTARAPVPVETAGQPARVATTTGLRLTPVAATNVLYGADVERTVRVSDSLAAQQVRLRYVDTVTWRDPQRGATYEWQVPREEVVMVPVRAD